METPPFEKLVHIPELMTNVLDFIGDQELFGVFSAKQLEHFWQYLPAWRQRDIYHDMFFVRIDFSRFDHSSGYSYTLVRTITQFITFFHFINANWKSLIKPYILEQDNGRMKLMSTPFPFVPFVGSFCSKNSVTKRKMNKFLCGHVQHFMMGMVEGKVKGFRQHSFDDRVLLLSFLQSIRPMVGSHFNVLCHPQDRRSQHPLYPLLLEVNTDLTEFVKTPSFDRARFHYIVDLLKSFGDYALRIHDHPFDYYRQVNHGNFDDVRSFLEENSSSASALSDKGAFVAKVCALTRKSGAEPKYSWLLWNHGCRCALHVDVISREIITRQLRLPSNVFMTGHQVFAHSKKVAVFCREVTDTALTPVGDAIYRALFMAGCRCRNHTSLVQ